MPTLTSGTWAPKERLGLWLAVPDTLLWCLLSPTRMLSPGPWRTNPYGLGSPEHLELVPWVTGAEGNQQAGALWLGPQ